MNTIRVRSSITLLAALALLFVLMPAAQADQVQMYFTGTTSGGILNPYKMVISDVNDPTPATGTTMWLNCDAYDFHVHGGQSWLADVFYGSGNNLSQTMMSQRNGWTEETAGLRYDAKAWLELNYSKADNPEFSYALWRLFDDNSPTPGGTLALYNLALSNATASGTNRQRLIIYSPVQSLWGPTAPQEFNQIPDGGVTLMLLGGALVGLETLRRRSRV